MVRLQRYFYRFRIHDFINYATYFLHKVCVQTFDYFTSTLGIAMELAVQETDGSEGLKRFQPQLAGNLVSSYLGMLIYGGIETCGLRIGIARC